MYGDYIEGHPFSLPTAITVEDVPITEAQLARVRADGLYRYGVRRSRAGVTLRHPNPDVSTSVVTLAFEPPRTQAPADLPLTWRLDELHLHLGSGGQGRLQVPPGATLTVADTGPVKRHGTVLLILAFERGPVHPEPITLTVSSLPLLGAYARYRPEVTPA